jgi:hypothetical protein
MGLEWRWRVDDVEVAHPRKVRRGSVIGTSPGVRAALLVFVDRDRLAVSDPALRPWAMPHLCDFKTFVVACVLTGVAYFVDDFLQRRGGPRFNWLWSYG